MNLVPNAPHLRTILLAVAVVCALLSVAATSLRPSNLTCVSNAGSLSLAVAEYVQDNDESFPPMSSTAAFQAAVSPYASTHSIFTCPVTAVDYRPNAALNHASLPSLSQDRGSVEVFRDGQVHADGLPTIGYADGHAERGGLSQMDPEQASLNNARPLGLALLQYTQDWDETLPPMHTPTEMQNALFPYLGTRRYFRSPVTGLPYTPNPALSGQPLARFPEPSATEWLRDPRRHRDGKSVVAYLDGHVVKQ